MDLLRSELRPADAHAVSPAQPGAGCAASTGHSKRQMLALALVPANHPGARGGRAAPAHATGRIPDKAVAAARRVTSPADVVPASAANASAVWLGWHPSAPRDAQDHNAAHRHRESLHSRHCAVSPSPSRRASDTALGLPPGIPLVHIGNRLVQQCFDIALTFALAHVAERTARHLHSLNPVKTEQLVGGGVWGESREKTLQYGLNHMYKQSCRHSR